MSQHTAKVVSNNRQWETMRPTCGFEFPQSHHIAVLLVLGGHRDERIIGSAAGKAHIRLSAPIPFVALEESVVVEEARVEAAHVLIASFIGMKNARKLLGGHAYECFFGVDPVREPPPKRCWMSGRCPSIHQ